MDYLRPKTIKEAVALLAEGIPLAGGTQLTQSRTVLTKVIDLQDLGLGEIQVSDGTITIGCMTTLQAILTSDLAIPDVLRQACRYEAAWNIRNKATLGGVLMGSDGRSPLMTALAALDPVLRLAPGDVKLSMGDLIERRRAGGGDFILLDLSFFNPKCLAYDFVARAPMDPPIVCAAAAIWDHVDYQQLSMALGGFGEYPTIWSEQVKKDSQIHDSVAGKAHQAYRDAGDAFASAAYRAEVASILAQRVVREVLEHVD